jgi:branched-chain amino acid transport system ATP-binding protein
MLRIQNLNVYYGGVHALRDVNLQVPPGSVVTLIGANGAGRAPPCAVFAGWFKNVQGSILYDGQELGGMKAYDRVRLGIAMVPEGRRIFTNLAVLENLKLGSYVEK